MMVHKYRRTISFPNPNPNRASTPKSASYHVRSSSLPCVRFQPLIPQLRDEINQLKSWQQNSTPDPITPWLVNGLARLKSVLDTLDDVLQLPQTHESLSSRANLVEKLLENFLQFVDVFGIFQASVLALKQELSGAQVAVRRNDDSKLAVHVKSQRKIGKEMCKLISAVRSIDCPIEGGDDITCLIRDVHVLTGMVSASVFEGVMKSVGPVRRRSGSWLIWKGDVEGGAVQEKRNGELKRIKELDECVNGMEVGTHRVFRTLLTTRVSLLNLLTHI